MSNDTNMDNRILAEFENSFLGPCKLLQYQTSFYHENYNDLHRVWEKFRELELPQYLPKLNQLKDEIAIALVTGTLTDLYNALVNAVKWYNEVKK